MRLAKLIEKIFKLILPSPFTIAVILTFLSMIIAFWFNWDKSEDFESQCITILSYWEKGLWNPSLLVFAMQMILMLVLGHVLALSRPVNQAINFMTNFCSSTAKAAFFVCLLSLIVSLFNWGLGLIFGAIFARKVAENANKNKWKIHYPLIGASGYSGLMVWHGGLSGSAPVKAAEEGHLKSLMGEIYSTEKLAALPDQLTFAETVLSPMNLAVSISLLIVLPIVVFVIGTKIKSKVCELNPIWIEEIPTITNGAEKLDHSKGLALIFGLGILSFAIYKAILLPQSINLSFINPNFINFFLLGLGILLHGNFYRFLQAIENAIGGASGILIQFPLYFGIMGIMKHSGIVVHLSDFFVGISSQESFPIFTFFSAGLVNIFIPSGGGQWAIQGPILIEASQQLGIDLGKNIMAMAYGDQITNMLQPFWALPLLGITGLKAKEILPYTLILMMVGVIIFIVGLLIF